MPHSDLQYEAELVNRTKLQEEMRREELLWQQKPRNTWLTTTDLNTHFHLSTLIRHRRNTIDSIKSSTGRWMHRRKDIGDTFVLHFSYMYKTSNPELALGIVTSIVLLLLLMIILFFVGLPTKEEI